MKHLILCLIIILFAFTLQAQNTKEKNDSDVKQGNKGNSSENNNKENGGGYEGGKEDVENNGHRRPWRPLNLTDTKVVTALNATKADILKQRKLPDTSKIEVKRAFEWKWRLSPKLKAKYRLVFKITTVDGKPVPKNNFCKAIIGQLNELSYKLFRVRCWGSKNEKNDSEDSDDEDPDEEQDEEGENSSSPSVVNAVTKTD